MKMYSISQNNMICLTRGDTFIAPLFINQGTKMVPIRYNLNNHPSATLYLGITEPNQPFEEAVIRKIYSKVLTPNAINKNGDVQVELKSTDTECLLPGRYYCEIKIQFTSGRIDTVVPKTEFQIVE